MQLEPQTDFDCLHTFRNNLKMFLYRWDIT